MTAEADNKGADAASSAPASRAALTVRVWRGAEEGGYQTYEVPRLEAQTVLDVVTYIQRVIDPTLSYRFACRVGVCGSCAMNVNGKARWTCRTRVSEAVDAKNRLRLEPLRNMMVVKDLAVDMAGFFEKWKAAHGYFEPGDGEVTGFAAVPPSSEEICTLSFRIASSCVLASLTSP